MRERPSEGKVNLRIWSADIPLRDLSPQIGLAASIVHDKGGQIRLPNGKVKASLATHHYVSFASYDLDGSAAANQRIVELLKAVQGTQLARLIANGSVRAEIDLAAFHGDIDWEAELSPSLIEAVHAANIELWICHYDKFTDEGAPLSVRL